MLSDRGKNSDARFANKSAVARVMSSFFNDACLSALSFYIFTDLFSIARAKFYSHIEEKNV